MNIHNIFDELREREQTLHKLINEKIQGNSEGNEYTFSESSRAKMDAELKVIQNTLAFLDEQIDMYNLTK